MTRLQERSAVCPVCSHAFGYEVLLSTNTAGGIESDLRARAVGTDPVPFTVLTCPQCRYSCDTGTFELPVPMKVAYELKGLAERLLAGPARHAGRFQLAAELAERHAEEPQDPGWMFLRASWMAREEGDAAAEATCQRRALDAFRRHLATPGGAGDAKLTYLAGELARRLGEFDAACAALAAVPAEERLYPDAQKMLARARKHDRSPGRLGE